MSKFRSLRALASAIAVVVCAGALSASAATIYDNKSTTNNAGQLGIVTNPGGGAGGFDASALQTGETSFGSSHTAGNRLADDFIVPAGQSWTITGAHVFGYLTGATTPTATAATIRFLDGSPLGGTPNVLAGDNTTNVLVPGSNVFMNLYRTNTTDIGTATNRRIQDHLLNLAAPLVLGPGTYWMEWTITGNSFVPSLYPSPAPGANVATGNAVQFQIATSTYVALVDTAVPKGVPFQIVGTVAGIPEPTSMALVSLGLIGLGLRRKS